MSWWNEFAEHIQCDVRLSSLTWFGLGGPARWMFHPQNAHELSQFVRRAQDESVPWKILGDGANVLVRDDGFDGVVIRLDAPSFKAVEKNGGAVRVGAGVDLMPFSRECSREGLSGLEGMAGIPATIGGALKMNAGGRFGEFGRSVREATVMNRDGSLETWSKERLGFGYRRSAIADRIVIDATLEFHESDPQACGRMFDENFRFKKLTQPMADKSAGCIFKNPQGQSAGAMIDQCGLKGFRRNGARVSEQHANFIVADASGTSSDVCWLIDYVRDRVQREWSTELEVEIDIW